MTNHQDQAELAAMLENIEISRQATLEHFVYFMHSPNDQNMNIRECVSVVDEHHAITYRHGEHEAYSKGEKITIKKCIDPEKKVKVEVHEAQDWEFGDFMLLRTVGDEKFERYPIGVREAKPAERCWIATPSLDNQHNTLRFLHGTVKQKLGNIFMSATTPGNRGDSGAGVYSANEGRFIGMVTSRRNTIFIGDYSDIKFVNAYPLVLKFTGKLDKEDPLNSLANIRGSSIQDSYGYGHTTSDTYGNVPTYSPCPGSTHGSYLYKAPTYTPTCGNVNGSWKNGSPSKEPMTAVQLDKETQTEVSAVVDEKENLQVRRMTGCSLLALHDTYTGFTEKPRIGHQT